MAYRLEDFPLHFDNAKSQAAQVKFWTWFGWMFLAAVVLACLFLNGLVLFGHPKGTPAWKLTLGLALPWGMFGLVLIPGLFNNGPDVSGLMPLENSTLVLDDQGVHVTIGRHGRDYLWPSILSAHVLDTTPEGRSKVHIRAVHIRLRGQFMDDRYANWIDGSFGINVDELQGLIQKGIERWGSPAPADFAP